MIRLPQKIIFLFSSFIFLLSSCHKLEKGPDYLPEKPITITGQIKDYNKEKHPQSIQFGYTQFWSMRPNSRFEFLDDEGRFEFTVLNSFIQDYEMLYGGQKFRFVATPGDSIHLIIEDETLSPIEHDHQEKDHYRSKYVLTSSNQRVQTSLDILRRLYIPETEISIQVNQPGDISYFKEKIKDNEELLNSRLDSIWHTGNYSDDILYRWFQQDIHTSNKNRLLGHLISPKVIQNSSGEDSLSMKYELLEDDLTYSLIYHPRVYNEGFSDYYSSAYGHLLHNSFLIMTIRNRDLYDEFAKERKYDQLYLRTFSDIDNYFQGFQKEIVKTRVFDLLMNSKSIKPDTINQVAEQFIENTRVESFARYLEELYSGSVIEPEYNAEQVETQISKLPEDVENVLSAIVEEFSNQVIVMDFWATWCAPCIQHLDYSFPEFTEKFKNEQVVFVFISGPSSPEHLWKRKIADLNFEGKHFRLDQAQYMTLTTLFNINAIPHLVLIDKSGKVVRNKAPHPGKLLEEMIWELL